MLTVESIKEMLSYSPHTGEFTWIIPTKRTGAAGKVAGSVSAKRGYRTIRILGKSYRAHRLAMLYMTGKMPSCEVDHINGIRDDNRAVNLRLASRTDNGRNQKKHTTNKSGAMGVRFRPESGSWRARIGASEIGTFHTLLDAACARKSAELQIGYHKNHGGR